jgi:hypothetical protein
LGSHLHPESLSLNLGLKAANYSAAGSICEPNQNVIAYAVIDVTNPVHIFTKLAHNLNSDDNVIITIQNVGYAELECQDTICFVIAYG